MLTILYPTELAVALKEKYQLTEFWDFNPSFCQDLCHIFEENGIRFNIPCPYVPNSENQGKYPWRKRQIALQFKNALRRKGQNSSKEF